MSWLDKLMKGHSERAVVAKDKNLVDYTEKLKALVYDEDLAKELAPIFTSLHGTQGFDKIVELLVTKEEQIAAISGGDFFKQELDEQHTEEESEEDESNKETLTASQILTNKYKTEKE